MKYTAFHFGDSVAFQTKNTSLNGQIVTVNPSGQGKHASEPSYDVFVNWEPEHPCGVLYKHIPQSRLHTADI